MLRAGNSPAIHITWLTSNSCSAKRTHITWSIQVLKKDGWETLIRGADRKAENYE
jgi:hypothetical protein